MAVAETICWTVLKRAHGESVLTSWLKGDQSTEPPLINAVPLFVLERELVLHHTKADIEAAIYFLEKRGYVIRHGFQGLTRVAFQLSDQAIAVLQSGSFSKEEQAAFREDLVDAKRPEFWGVTLNLGEIWRRTKTRLLKRPP